MVCGHLPLSMIYKRLQYEFKREGDFPKAEGFLPSQYFGCVTPLFVLQMGLVSGGVWGPPHQAPLRRPAAHLKSLFPGAFNRQIKTQNPGGGPPMVCGHLPPKYGLQEAPI